MKQLRVIDLYCGAGGATKGLQRAGFHVTGVDHKPQKNYCGDAFIQADALEVSLEGYDFIWASPPCQKYSHIRKQSRPGNEHPDLVAPTRDRLIESGTPYVIENVGGSPLLRGSIMLCGEMFGLKTYRHRWFECSWGILAPQHIKHPETCPRGGRQPSASGRMSVVGNMPNLPAARRAMGIQWMNRKELSQAIPPAYSEYIARQFLDAVARRQEAT